MTGWAALEDELARWRDQGRAPDFWWRDDDAVGATDALDRLLTLNRHRRVPISLAVIPGLAGPSLAGILDGRADVAILQHGFRHVNHASGTPKKSELGSERAAGDIAGDLTQGRALMEALFTGAALPVLTPPWNRVDAAIVKMLPGLGFAGISGFGARPKRDAMPGLIRVNTHVDIIDWTGGRGFRGTDAVLTDLCIHLSARRAGAVDATEPTGLLTHHLVHDQACWEFMDKLLEKTSPVGSCSWKTADEIFMSPADLH